MRHRKNQALPVTDAETPNIAFKPKLHRYANNMAGGACHVVGYALQVGLTQALRGFLGMNDYLVSVERDSVCMGDDVDAPHAYSFRVLPDATFDDVFEHLARKGYLAYVAGKNHSWEAIVDGKPCAFFAGNNMKLESTKILTGKVSEFVRNGTLTVRFRYNSATT